MKLIKGTLEVETENSTKTYPVSYDFDTKEVKGIDECFANMASPEAVVSSTLFVEAGDILAKAPVTHDEERVYLDDSAAGEVVEKLGFKDGFSFILEDTYSPLELLRLTKDAFYEIADMSCGNFGEMAILDMELKVNLTAQTPKKL